MRRSIIGASLSALSLLLSAAATAMPVTFDFSGSVTRVSVNNFGGSPVGGERVLGLLPGSLNHPDEVLGQSLSGSVTLDADIAVDADWDWDPTSSLYFNVVSAFSVSLGGITLALDPAKFGIGGSVFVESSLNVGLVKDRVSVNANLGTGTLPGPASILSPALTLFGLRERDASFSGPPFPMNFSGPFPGDLTVLQNTTLGVYFYDFQTITGVTYFADLNSITRRVTAPQTNALLSSSNSLAGLVTVPETSTPLLLGLGMLTLLYRTRRRNTHVRHVPS